MTSLIADINEAARFARHAGNVLRQIGVACTKDAMTLAALSTWVALLAFGSWEMGSQIVAARTATMVVGAL